MDPIDKVLDALWTAKCPACGTQFKFRPPSTSYEISQIRSIDRTLKEVKRWAQYVSCPACGLLPRRTYHQWTAVFIVSLGLVAMPLGIALTNVLLAPSPPSPFILLAPALFLVGAFVAYRVFLPKGIDLNAPAFVRARIDPDWEDGPPRQPGPRPDKYFLFLWMVTIMIGLPVGTVSGLMLVYFPGARIVFGLSVILVLWLLYLMGKHMYSAESDPREVTVLFGSSKPAPRSICDRCEDTVFRQSEFLSECGRAGLLLVNGNLYGGRNDQDKVELFRKLEDRKGFRCVACSNVYCGLCLSDSAPVHANGGKACFNCRGSFELFA